MKKIWKYKKGDIVECIRETKWVKKEQTGKVVRTGEYYNNLTYKVLWDDGNDWWIDERSIRNMKHEIIKEILS